MPEDPCQKVCHAYLLRRMIRSQCCRESNGLAVADLNMTVVLPLFVHGIEAMRSESQEATRPRTGHQ
eukprot:scaffold10896_cov20-Prasinocladus_malaysianus.AAC.3